MCQFNNQLDSGFFAVSLKFVMLLLVLIYCSSSRYLVLPIMYLCIQGVNAIHMAAVLTFVDVRLY